MCCVFDLYGVIGGLGLVGLSMGWHVWCVWRGLVVCVFGVRVCLCVCYV